MSKKKKQSGSSSTEIHGRSDVNLLDESSEPRADRAPIPMFLVVLLVILFFLGDIFLMANRGEFDSRVYEPYADMAAVERDNPPDPAKILAAKGKRVYETVCSACHQPNGMGSPGQFPPLAGSDWALAEGPNRIIRLVLSGIQGPITVSGQAFNNAMPPWGAVLKDDDIAAVITYIRSEWGNRASGVTPEQVAEIRSKLGDHAPWSPEELLQVPAK